MKKNICSLIVQFSFLPQVIWAVALHRRLAANSYVLTNGALQTAFLLVFAEIVIFAALTSFKRFYAARFLLVGAYIQLILTMALFGFRLERWVALNNETYYFIAFGALMTAINAIAFYIYKGTLNEKDSDYNRRG
ncbi:MAG: hypothetical protein FWE74_00685 [Oscillospiraceae bacterium]|nr:hypothetical protein [Oscillospiraceae bacterium]